MTLHKLHTIKKRFPKLLKESYGIISIACRKAGIERRTYYNWRNKDINFAYACDEVIDATGDIVEAALLKKIQEGNTSAIIFYCKTKLKDRGYSQNAQKVYVNSSSFLNENDQKMLAQEVQKNI